MHGTKAGAEVYIFSGWGAICILLTALAKLKVRASMLYVGLKESYDNWKFACMQGLY